MPSDSKRLVRMINSFSSPGASSFFTGALSKAVRRQAIRRGESWCLGDLDASFFAGAARDRHDPFPFADLIDGPRVRLALIKSLRVFAARIKVDGLREPFLQDKVQKRLRSDGSPFQR